VTATTMTPADLAAALRAKVTPSNEAALQRCLDAADAECLAAVDPDLVVNPLAIEEQPLYDSVVLQRSVEWWKANDAAFGIVGTAEVGGLRAPKDGFDRHYTVLAPLKQQWGCA
jgi:hypothetical protein